MAFTTEDSTSREPLRTFGDVRAAIDALPPPAEGRVRVFRGQSRHYVPLLPSGRRRRLIGHKIWMHYSRRMIETIFPQENISIPGGGDIAPLERELQVSWLWLAAVAQHYGPGSEYIDVTHDVSTALWFALHDPVFHKHEMVLGPPGPASVFDEIVRTEWVGFRRIAEPGRLYVFDVPKWDARVFPEPGVLVDLAEAPAPFSDSVRMRAPIPPPPTWPT